MLDLEVPYLYKQVVLGPNEMARFHVKYLSHCLSDTACASQA